MNGSAYDAAGNLLTGSYTYDAENRLFTSPGVTYDYDPDGRRVQKSDGTLYWYDTGSSPLQETNLSGTLKEEYIFFGGKRIARREDGAFQSSATMQNGSFSQANPFDQGPCFCYNFGPIPGWTSTGAQTGSWQPSTASYNAPLPGIVVYSNGGTISQTLATGLQANTTYTLLVDVGHRLEGGINNYSLTLQAGSTVLATTSGSNGATPPGSFLTGRLIYTTGSAPPAGNVTIVLTSFGAQINFKNVRLNLSSVGAVHYYFADHLGSTDIVTNASGIVEEEREFYPYGGERIILDSGIGNNYKFTGKERDPETGLDEFGARYYSSTFGRFTIPDWAAAPTAVPYAHFGNPQSLNLYSYVLNNPTTFGDPDGHYWGFGLGGEPVVRGSALTGNGWAGQRCIGCFNPDILYHCVACGMRAGPPPTTEESTHNYEDRLHLRLTVEKTRVLTYDHPQNHARTQIVTVTRASFSIYPPIAGQFLGATTNTFTEEWGLNKDGDTTIVGGSSAEERHQDRPIGEMEARKLLGNDFAAGQAAAAPNFGRYVASDLATWEHAVDVPAAVEGGIFGLGASIIHTVHEIWRDFTQGPPPLD